MNKDQANFATDKKFEAMYVDFGLRGGTSGWIYPNMYPELLESNARIALGFNMNGEISLREAFYYELPEMLKYMNTLPDYFDIKKDTNND